MQNKLKHNNKNSLVIKAIIEQSNQLWKLTRGDWPPVQVGMFEDGLQKHRKRGWVDGSR